MEVRKRLKWFMILGISILVYLYKSYMLCSTDTMDSFPNSQSIDMNGDVTLDKTIISSSSIFRALIFCNHCGGVFTLLCEVSKLFVCEREFFVYIIN